MPITIDHLGRVNASITIPLPLPAPTVWGQLRDWRRLLTLDPLHHHITIHNDDSPAARSPARRATPQGTRLTIRHSYLALHVDRDARILTWNEGRGYAISDLSKRNPNRAFPHVCAYEVVPTAPDSCNLVVSARGRWTAHPLTRPLARCWMAWVLTSTRAHILTELAAFTAWHKRRSSREPTC